MTKIARERKMREGGVGRMKPEFSRVDDGMIPHRKPTGAYALMAPITLSNLIGHALAIDSRSCTKRLQRSKDRE